jgi:hypothetical protein
MAVLPLDLPVKKADNVGSTVTTRTQAPLDAPNQLRDRIGERTVGGHRHLAHGFAQQQLGCIHLQRLMQTKLILPHSLQHLEILLERSGAWTHGQDWSLVKLCDGPLNLCLVIMPQPLKHQTEEPNNVGSTDNRRILSPRTIENRPTKQDIQEHPV